MVFFQAALLVGYSYAHLLTRRGTVHRQLPIHAPVLLLPLLFASHLTATFGWP